MRRQHQVVVFDDQIVNRNDRQIQLHGAPVSAVVERDEHAALGSAVQQSLLLRILADRSHKSSVRDAAYDPSPSVAVIAGLIDVGMRSSF